MAMGPTNNYLGNLSRTATDSEFSFSFSEIFHELILPHTPILLKFLINTITCLK